MGEPPLGYCPIPRGNSTLIPLVLGITDGNFKVVGVPRLQSTDRDITHRSSGMGQVGVLGTDCVDYVATGAR